MVDLDQCTHATINGYDKKRQGWYLFSPLLHTFSIFHPLCPPFHHAQMFLFAYISEPACSKGRPPGIETFSPLGCPTASTCWWPYFTYSSKFIFFLLMFFMRHISNFLSDIIMFSLFHFSPHHISSFPVCKKKNECRDWKCKFSSYIW